MGKFLSATLFSFVLNLLISLSYGWEPGTQYVYKYSGRSAAGIYRLKLQNAVIELQSRVVVQCLDYTNIVVKLTDNRIRRNGNYVKSPYFGSEKGHPEEIEGDEDKIFNRELLSSPFMITYNAGAIISITTGADEPQWIINFKKSVASQLQLDLSGVHYQGPPLNMMAPKTGDSISFPVYEDSITGNCSVTISVSKLRQFQIDSSDATALSSFEAVCKGKPVYQIVKTKDYDKCTRSPTRHYSTSNYYSCSFDKANCGEFMQRTSLYKFLACGENYPNVIVVHASGFTDLVAQPFATRTDELVNSVVITWSIEKEEPISSRLILPSSVQEHKSLAYANEGSNQSNQNRTTAVPNLIDAPVKSTVPISIVHNSIIDAFQIIGRNLKDKADTEKDNMERLSLVTRMLSMFSLGELRNLWQEVKLQSTVIQGLFVDCVVVAGSNPTVMLIKELVESQQIIGSASDFALSSIGHYMKNPTDGLLKEIVNLLKSDTLQSSQTTVQTTLMTIADLLNDACSSASAQRMNTGVLIVGDLCDRKDIVIVKEFLPLLVKELNSNQDTFNRIVTLSALGSLAVEEIVPILLPIIRGTPDILNNTAERLQAVLSLSRLVEKIPEKIYPILVSLASNFGERSEIRMASLEILLMSNAPLSIWQKFAASTWFDSSQQMQSFVFTLIHSMTQLKPSTPLFRDLIEKARIALLMAKPSSFGVYSSFANTRSSHLDNDITVIMKTISLRHSDQSLPVYLNHRYYHQLGPFKRKPLSVSLFNFNTTSSLQELIYRFYDNLSKKDDANIDNENDILKELWTKLNAAVKSVDKNARILHINLLNSINRFISLDQLDESIRKNVNTFIKYQGRQLELGFGKFLMLAEHNVHFVTELGLPMRYQLTMPLLTSLQGTLIGDKKTGLTTDLHIDFGLKLNAELRVDFPFNGNYIATGVDVLVRSHIPMKMNFQYVKGDARLEWIPGDKLTDLFYYHVKPYTITRNQAGSTKPTFEDPAGHLISVTDNPIHRDLPIGDAIGINLRLQEHSESTYSDKLSWMEYLSKMDLNLIFNLGFVPADIRHRKYVLRYDPSGTRCRTFLANIFYQYASKTNKNTVVIESGSSHLKKITSSEVVSYNPIVNEFHPLLGRLFGILESGEARMLGANLTIEQVNGTTININSVVGLGVNDRYDKDMVDWQTEYRTKSGPHGSKKSHYSICFATTRNWDNPTTHGFSPNVLTMNQLTQVAFGPTCEHKVKLSARLSRDEEAARAAIDSPSGQQCHQDMESGFKHGSPSCTEARTLDHAYNNYEISMETEHVPKSWLQWSRQSSTRMNAILDPFIVKHIHGQSNPQNRTIWKIKRDLTTGDSNMEFVRPHETVIAENVRFGTLTSRLFQLSPIFQSYSSIFYPVSASRNILQKSKSISSSGISDVKCYVGTDAVYTYDGVHYNYTIDDCTHVLVTDCHQETPFAVLAEKSHGQKIVAIIYGKDILVLDPANGFVTVNKVKIPFATLSEGNHIEIRSTQLKSIQALVFPLADGGVILDVRSLHFSIKVQGSDIELSAPVQLRGRSCGLCGDYNQDIDDEFKTPGRCSLSSGDLMAASFKLKTGNGCSNESNETSHRLQKAIENCQSVDQQFQTYLPDYNFERFVNPV